MKRIALLAYACKADEGSEPGAGFQWAMAAAKIASVELISRPLDCETRDKLQAAGIIVNEVPVVHSAKIPQLSYLRWLLRAQIRLKKIHSAQPLSLVHHLTYATDWLPAPRIEGIPLIWGPVGGSTGLPKGLRDHFSRKLLAKEIIRANITGAVRLFTRRWAKRNVDLLIAQNQDTTAKYAHVRRRILRPNYVIQSDCTGNRGPRDNKDIMMVGRLIEMKGVHIAIAALEKTVLKEWTLHVIGDGPMRERLESQAQESGVSDRVVFHGRVPRAAVLERLANARCSLLLSTHDAAGWAAAESISVGTPVHTWSHGGPAELVRLTRCGTTTEPGPDSLSVLAQAIANQPSCNACYDMSNFNIDNLSIELSRWYDETTR